MEQQLSNARKYYYLCSQSAESRHVFLDKTDYEYFLRLVEKYKGPLSVLVYGFCLLPTESHIIISAPDYSKITAFWQNVHYTYGDYFRMRYETETPIWQKNFNERSIVRSIHLLYFLKFIEFIPVQSALSFDPAGYPWSSASHRMSGQKCLRHDYPLVEEMQTTI